MTEPQTRTPSRAARRRTVAPPTSPAAPTNEVRLVGRVSAAAVERELPSGDVLASWRVVVDRPAARAAPPGVRAPRSDTLACVAWSARVRRAALALQPGDVVEVVGALRQRFWRAGAALGSRTEVEVCTLRRQKPSG